MNLKGWFFKAILLGLLFVGYYIWTYNFSCNKLTCLNINLDGYKESKVYENTPSAYRVLYVGEAGDIVRVEKKKVEKENQESVINSAIQKIYAYFENTNSPYPGQISNEIECPESFVPELTVKKIGGDEVNYFEVYLTERLAIGACSDNQAKNKEIIVWYYCENQESLYQLEIISEKERFNQNKEYYYGILDSLSCK